MNGEDTPPGGLHRLTWFLVLKVIALEENRNAQSQPHVGPLAILGVTGGQAKEASPGRGGGWGPQREGDGLRRPPCERPAVLASFRVGKKDPESTDAPTQPSLQTWRRVAAGHTGVPTPHLRTGRDGVASALGDKQRLFPIRSAVG